METPPGGNRKITRCPPKRINCLCSAVRLLSGPPLRQVRHGALLPAEALDALGAPLRQATRALRERHAASLGEGRRILERAPRGEMLALATPRGGERSRDT